MPRGNGDSMSPGLRRRMQDVAAAERELSQFNAEVGGAMRAPTGSVHLRQRLATAQRALDRQRNVAEGRPALAPRPKKK